MLDVGRSPHEARARRTQLSPYVFLTKTKTKKGNKEARKEKKQKKPRLEEKKKRKEEKKRKQGIPKYQKTERPEDRLTRRPNERPQEKEKRRYYRKVDPGGTITLYLAYYALAKQTKREVLDGINTQGDRVSKTAHAQNIPASKLVYDNLTHPPTISYC